MGAPVEHISSRIFIVRGQRIMLDTDLAGLYGVSTSALIQAVKRNLGRFPPDFMFQLTEQELRDLRSQSVISKPRLGRGGRRSPPYAFSEQGVAMLSSVLRSERAIAVNIAIMRAFAACVSWHQRMPSSSDNSTIWSDALATTTERSRTSCAPSGISPLLVHPRSAGSDSFSRQRRKGD